MQLPFEKEGQQLTVLSHGIGQDSMGVLARILHDDDFRKKYIVGNLIVVSADTKNEHDHTNDYTRYLKKILFDNDISFFHLSPEKYANGNWKKGLVEFYRRKGGVGSKAFPKQCTDNLKIRPIYRFLEEYVHRKFQTKQYGRKKAFYEYFHQYGQIRVLLGIAAGEERRVSEETGIKWFDTCIERVYPLIEEGMDRKACQEVIARYGYKVPYPSNCKLCPFMSLQELLYLYRYYPEDYQILVSLEATKLEKYKNKGKKNLGVWGTEKTVPEMLEVALEKYGHWTREELEEYKFSHGHCNMSKY